MSSSVPVSCSQDRFKMVPYCVLLAPDKLCYDNWLAGGDPTKGRNLYI